MIKRLFAFVLVFALVLSFVVAVETQITVRTVPGCNVTITAFSKDSGEFIVFGKEKGLSDENGFYNVSFSTGSGNFGMHVYVTQNNREISSQRFPEDFKSGKSVNVVVAPEWYNVSLIDEVNNANQVGEQSEPALAPITVSDNTTSQVTNNTATQEDIQPTNTTNSLPITGNPVSTEGILTAQNIYIALGVIAAIVIIWVIIWLIRKPRSEEAELRKVQARISSITSEIESIKRKKQSQKESLSTELDKLNQMEEELKREQQQPQQQPSPQNQQYYNGQQGGTY